MDELIADNSILDYLHKEGRLTKQTVALRKLGITSLISYVSNRFLDGIEPFHSEWETQGHNLYYAVSCTESHDTSSEIILQIIDKNSNKLFVADITIEIDNSPLNGTFYEASYRIKLKNHINKKENILLEKVGARYTSDFPSIDADFALRDVLFST